SFLLAPLGIVISPIIAWNNKKNNSFYKLLYLSYLFSLAYNIVALTGLVADVLNWGITSYH
ncbi:hypothetical protein, partial [Staphylococcus xylosus]|uniref:hypothetical protein n=1 Tax=Staphylococcus xylosus TaxID=1288 RepID=UPI00210D3690